MSFNKINQISPKISPKGSPSRINVKNSPKTAFNEEKVKKVKDFSIKYRDGNWRQAFNETFVEFCDCTSIHGIKHFLNNSWFERLLWIVLFVISITGCSLMISLVWQKWNQSPVILSFDNKLMTMAAIPFPAVTICPDAKADVTDFNYKESYEKYVNNVSLSEEEIAHLFAMDSIYCNKITKPLIKLPDRTIDEKLMEKLSHSMENLVSCNSGLNNVGTIVHNPCLLEVQHISTNQGRCYTFNTLDSTEMFNPNVVHDFPSHGFEMAGWDPHKGYASYIRGATYPKRSFGAGTKRGVSFTLKTKIGNFVNQCNNETHHGFNIYLHPPTDYPWKKEYMYKVGMNQQMAIIIKPPSIITSDNLKDYPISKRKCYFEGERNLNLFRFYSQSNCELECLVHIMYKKCGCVDYWMPRLPNIPDCRLNRTFYNANCSSDDIEYAVQEERVKTIVDTDGRLECNCLPNCNSIQYEADQTMLLNKDCAKIEEGSNAGYEHVDILLYYKTFQFIPMKRTELYTDLDFISNCGGLLSLFIGTSLLSIVEVLYFFTIRLLDNIKAKKNN